MTELLEVKAGPEAFRHIQEHGLKADDVSLMLGASGGPKWFILQGLDNYLFGDFLHQRTTPMNLLGTSAGAWRFASLGRGDAAQASRLFCELYRATVYTAKPDVKEITDKARVLLETYVTDDAIDEILTQERFRHHMIVVRSKGLGVFENRFAQGLGLLTAATANAVSRKYLGHFFERVVFHHPKCEPPLGRGWSDLPTRHIQLTRENFRDALLATGSIPMVLAGVRDIPGAPAGIYRDGGVTDYHFDLDLSEQQGIALYPHFQREIIPGWFDKHLKRRVQGGHWPRVVTLMPTQAFIDQLPYGKIPDRKDFAQLAAEPRQAYWQEAVEQGYRLADQLQGWVESGEIAQRVKLWS
ncbi:MAG: alpha/beta hydrolase [Idiomarina sp.]|nr:alpha/beta hydrolase [Idiomarina sp.]